MSAAKEREQDRVARMFATDVADHTMRVRLHHGLHRDLAFARPGSSVYHFAITTWPGYLCVSGDMGTFVFARIRDMFEFFRNEQQRVNPSYWSEKLQAPSGTGRNAATEYSPELFRQYVREQLEEFLEAHQVSDAGRQEARDIVRDEVLARADDGEQAAVHAAMSVELSIDGKNRTPFAGFWEVSYREYTYQFLWCCHAIVWGIAQWDALGADGAA